MQFERLENIFGILREAFELFPAVIWMRELDHFNFVELMLADDAAGVTTSGACFAAEAWAERTIFHRQIFFAEDLVAVVVGDRNLCGWNQIIIGVLKMEHVFCEFWQLTGAEIRRAVGHVWRDELGVAVLIGVHVDHERNDRAFETGSQAL